MVSGIAVCVCVSYGCLLFCIGVARTPAPRSRACVLPVACVQARNEEKANSMMNKWVTQKENMSKGHPGCVPDRVWRVLACQPWHALRGVRAPVALVAVG